METTRACDLPDFGTVVEREHLIGMFRVQRLGFVVACAPAGYGKSVFASQVASCDCFDEAIWISGFDEDMQADQLLPAVAHALTAGVVLDGHVPSSLPAAFSQADAMLAIRASLDGRRDSAVCLVVDGCNHVEDLAMLQELAFLLRKVTSHASSLVLTCRSVGRDGESVDPTRTWIVDEDDLRFTREELKRLQAQLGLQVASSPDLMDRFQGHPALTCLMLRHVELEDVREVPKDLVWYVDRLIAGLSDEGLHLLYVLSLLREDSLSAACGCMSNWPPPESVWMETRAMSPLLSVAAHGPLDSGRFRVHAVLRDAAYRVAPSRLGAHTASRSRSMVLRYLYSAKSYDRLHAALKSACDESEVVEWCEKVGTTFLRFLGSEATSRVLSCVSPTTLSGNPKLLVIRACTLREREEFGEASAVATLAASLAEESGDHALWVRCMLLIVRLALDTSDVDAATRGLTQLVGSGRPLSAEDSRLIDAYSAVVATQRGHVARSEALRNRLFASLDAIQDLGSDEAAFTLNCLAGLEALRAGRWCVAAELLARLADRPDLSALQRIQTRANLAACHLELGSLRLAMAELDEVVEAARAAGLSQLAAHAYGTRSNVCNALGDDAGAHRDYELCETLLGSTTHDYARLAEKLNSAMNRRARGFHEDALALAEEVQLVGKGCQGFLNITDVASLEVAASLLALGDKWAAVRISANSRDVFSRVGAVGCIYRADLILAEADRIDGAIEAAVARLAEHAEYVATGSANWLTAMYVRAFPGLLGLLADALGAAALPLRMLLMIPPDALDRALEMAPYLSAEDAEVLRRRRGGEGQSMNEELPPAETPSTSKHVCHARLFGGLEVMTDAGPVDEDSWRKRKARLLFLILLLRQHQDVPRDVLLERLWPEMDEDHAKRNFYVTWSTMKRALACGRPPSAAKTLVQCSGGVCRVTRQVRSDLDDFEEALAGLRAASAVNDAATVLACARRLVDIYRGELLPGDLYEEWFAEVRERTKHDFCDAMMAASNAAEAKGDAESALLFLRKASAADPWREDVYQSTMRCQMNAGQRSRAIETYLSCRSRLTEDLGIDPSIETTRIYQAVLAMDPGADDVAAVSIATSG